MNALRYIAVVLLLVALFGPGMAVLLDPMVALGVGLIALVLVALSVDDGEENSH